MITVSVIVPVYNTEKYLKECIKSVLSQTIEDIELIIVDDGSTDASLSIAERFAVRDGRIKVIAAPHLRQGAARNMGLRNAAGEYVMFLDSDDILKEDAVRICYEKCSAEGAEFATFDAEGFMDPDDPPLNAPDDLFDRSKLGIGNSLYDGVSFWKRFDRERGVQYGPVLHFVRREFIERNELFFAEGIYYEDNDWILRMYLAAEKMMYIPEKLYLRRYRKGSVMTEKRDDTASDIEVFKAASDIFMKCERPDERDMALSVAELAIGRVRCAGGDAAAENNGYENYARHLAGRAAALDEDDAFSEIDPEAAASYFDMHLLMMGALIQAAGKSGDAAERIDAIRREMVRRRFGLSDPSKRAAIYGAGKISGSFADWYEKNGGPIGERCRYIMTHPDRLYHRERRIIAPGGDPAGSPDVIVVAVSEKDRRLVSEIIDGVYGKEQRRVFFHALIAEDSLSYGL